MATPVLYAFPESRTKPPLQDATQRTELVSAAAPLPVSIPRCHDVAGHVLLKERDHTSCGGGHVPHVPSITDHSALQCVFKAGGPEVWHGSHHVAAGD